jgi:hypothetical protein
LKGHTPKIFDENSIPVLFIRNLWTEDVDTLKGKRKREQYEYIEIM